MHSRHFQAKCGHAAMWSLESEIKLKGQLKLQPPWYTACVSAPQSWKRHETEMTRWMQCRLLHNWYISTCTDSRLVGQNVIWRCTVWMTALQSRSCELLLPTDLCSSSALRSRSCLTSRAVLQGRGVLQFVQHGGPLVGPSKANRSCALLSVGVGRSVRN